MEPANQRGQILIECALVTAILVVMLIYLLKFHESKVEVGARDVQIKDFSVYQNSPVKR